MAAARISIPSALRQCGDWRLEIVTDAGQSSWAGSTACVDPTGQPPADSHTKQVSNQSTAQRHHNTDVLLLLVTFRLAPGRSPPRRRSGSIRSATGLESLSRTGFVLPMQLVANFHFFRNATTLWRVSTTALGHARSCIYRRRIRGWLFLAQ